MADTQPTVPLTPAAIELAHEKIKPYIHRTPLITCKTLDRIASFPNPATYLHDAPPPAAPTPDSSPPTPQLRIHLKLENTQRTGSFKARGAFHALTTLVSTFPGGATALRTRGVATHSSGNHAQALALAARTFHVSAYIVMPRATSGNKVAATRGHGAEVVFCEGHTVRDRVEGLKGVLERTGAVEVPPFDDERVIVGQGTVGVEVEGQFREGSEAAAAGGDGTKKGGPGTRVFGAEPSYQGANDVERGLAQGVRVEAVNSLTIAEGCRGVVGLKNWDIIRDKTKVEGVYSVTEDEIQMAMRLLFERAKTVVEPSGAVPLAVVLFNQEWRRWVAEQQKNGEIWDVAVVLSGGNTTMEALATLFKS